MSRDTRYEQLLNRHHALYDYVDSVPLTDIDEAASLNNQARKVRLIPELVERYTAAMQEGAEFPAIILWKGPRGFVTITGNHRFTAARAAGREAHDAYIVKTTDSYEIDVLTRVANNTEGAPPSKAELLEQALFTAKRHNRTLAETAERFGLTVESLANYSQFVEAVQKLESVGVNTEDMPRGTVRRLGMLRQRPVMTALGQLAELTGWSEVDVNHHVAAINRLDSEADQLQYITELKDAPDTRDAMFNKAHAAPGRHKRRGRRVEKVEFLRYLTSIQNLLDRCGTLEELQLSEAVEREAALKKIQAVQTRLRRLTVIPGSQVRRRAEPTPEPTPATAAAG